MNCSKLLFVCLIVLVSLSFSLASVTNVKRSGSFPGSPCTATLKNQNKKNAAKFNWQFWKAKTTTWQRRFPSGTTGDHLVTLFTANEAQCSATFWVHTDTCSLKQNASGKPG